jgi:hypothetical protein
MGLPMGEGLRFLIDGQTRFLRSGLEVFLRVQNFKPSGDWQEMGFVYTPSNPADTGYADIVIDPPPQVKDVSMHNIGMSGGKLLIGARYFIISQTFVNKIREQNTNIPDDISVWSAWDGETPVVGIMYENRMHQIVTYAHNEIGGETITWRLTCNRVDVPVDPGTAAVVAEP